MLNLNTPLLLVTPGELIDHDRCLHVGLVRFEMEVPKLNVKELRAELRARGLKATGKSSQ